MVFRCRTAEHLCGAAVRDAGQGLSFVLFPSVCGVLLVLACGHAYYRVLSHFNPRL